MASIGDVARALGFSVLSGFGTAEEQRERAYRERQLAEQSAWRQQQAEESKRVHDLQYGFVGPEELALYEPILKDLGVVLPQSAQIRRSTLTPLITLAGQRERRESDMVDVGDLASSFGLEIPTRAIPTGPIAAGQPGYGIGEEAGAGYVPETIEARPPVRVPAQRLGEYSTLIRNLRESGAAKSKAEAVAAARTQMNAGADLETVLARYPTLTAKDVLGYEPAAPQRPERPATHFGPTGEIVRVTPEGEVKTLRSGQPDEAKTLDLEYKRLRNRVLQEKQAATVLMTDLREAMRTKTLKPDKALTEAAKLQRSAEKWLEAAEQADLEGKTDDAATFREAAKRNTQFRLELETYAQTGQAEAPASGRDRLSRRDPRYKAARQRGLTDEAIQRRFGLQLVD